MSDFVQQCCICGDDMDPNSGSQAHGSCMREINPFFGLMRNVRKVAAVVEQEEDNNSQKKQKTALETVPEETEDEEDSDAEDGDTDGADEDRICREDLSALADSKCPPWSTRKFGRVVVAEEEEATMPLGNPSDMVEQLKSMDRRQLIEMSDETFRHTNRMLDIAEKYSNEMISIVSKFPKQ